MKSEPKPKAEPKTTVKVERVKPKIEGKGKAAATKGETLKRKRTEVKAEPDSSDIEEMEVDQLRDDPEGEFAPAPQRAAPSKPKRAAPAPTSPSQNDVSTPPPAKRPRRAAADAPKRYTHSPEEMLL